MDIRVLNYFLAVTREGSISKAAQSLHITQPTLSRQLMDLEYELGKQLFTRSNKRISLTPAGMFLQKRAEEILSLVHKTTDAFATPEDDVSGDVYIGCAESYLMKKIFRVATKLHSISPNIHYHIYSNNADDITQKLDKGLIDFAILMDCADKKKYNFLQVPGEDIWGLLMRKDSPLAHLKFIKPEDIYDLPLICSNQTMVSSQIAGWAKVDFNKLNIVATYNLIYNASLMVEEGLGYAFGVDKLVNVSKNSSLYFRPLRPKLTAMIDIIWKKNQIFSRQADIFLKTLQSELPTML